MAQRALGALMAGLGGALLWFLSTGALMSAPLILLFGALGATGAVALGLWAVIAG